MPSSDEIVKSLEADGFTVPQTLTGVQPGPDAEPVAATECDADEVRERREIMAKDDTLRVPGQNFCLLSVAAPEGTRQRASQTALKIRGAFATREEADARAAELHEIDPDFDIWTVAMWTWSPLCPSDPDAVDTKYDDPELQAIMDRAAEDRCKAKAEMDARRQAARDESTKRKELAAAEEGQNA